LWPGTHSAERPSAAKSTGRCPAVCAASTASGIPRSAQILENASSGNTEPQTFDAWLTSASLVFGRISGIASAGSVSPFLSAGIL